ncbi:MAG: hypothetical protein AAAFM81_12755 [Pseudomonadota bacterium]
MTLETQATAALCALTFATVALLLLYISEGLLRVMGRWHRGVPLINEPGQHARRTRHKIRASLRRRLTALLVGLASAATALVLPIEQQIAWPNGLPVSILATAIVVLITLAVMSFRDIRRIRHLESHIRQQRYIALQLSSIAGDHYRMFHDVRAQDEGDRIDHVLIGVQGAFAIVSIQGKRGAESARLQNHRLIAGDMTIDLAPKLKDVKRLQHALSKPLGRMIRLRPVICTNLPVKTGEYDGVLVTGLRDIVMLQGWRNAEDAFLREDFEELVKNLVERASD